MRAADPRRRASPGALGRVGQRHARSHRVGSFAGSKRTETLGRFFAGVGRHCLDGTVAASGLDRVPGGSCEPRSGGARRASGVSVGCPRRPCAVDERGAGGARRVERSQGAHRGRARRRSGGVGSRSRVPRRIGAAAAAAQADAVCRALAVRPRPHHVRARRTRLGRKPACACVRWTAVMNDAILDLIDLASERLGGAVVFANDEFFAAKENLIKAAAPVWREGVYDERGKWMDGWETRRRRDLGPDAHDWCVVRLGARGIVHGIDVETAFFTGNYPESFALDACGLAGMPTPETLTQAAWHELHPRQPLQGDAHNRFAVERAAPATHLRLRIYPDGGVARLRVFGTVVPDWERLRRHGDVDLAAVEHGGTVVSCSDMFYGSRHNLIMPGEATHMGDGWETKRRRGPGHDWTIVRFGIGGSIRRLEVDTRHFKGNAPGACSVDAVRLDDGQPLDAAAWREVLPRTPLQPHARHMFEDELRPITDATHARLNIFPDGGIARLRIFGRPQS